MRLNKKMPPCYDSNSTSNTISYACCARPRILYVRSHRSRRCRKNGRGNRPGAFCCSGFSCRPPKSKAPTAGALVLTPPLTKILTLSAWQASLLQAWLVYLRAARFMHRTTKKKRTRDACPSLFGTSWQKRCQIILCTLFDIPLISLYCSRRCIERW